MGVGGRGVRGDPSGGGKVVRRERARALERIGMGERKVRKERIRWVRGKGRGRCGK